MKNNKFKSHNEIISFLLDVIRGNKKLTLEKENEILRFILDNESTNATREHNTTIVKSYQGDEYTGGMDEAYARAYEKKGDSCYYPLR